MNTGTRYSASVESYLQGIHADITKARRIAGKPAQDYENWRNEIEALAYAANPANRR